MTKLKADETLPRISRADPLYHEVHDWLDDEADLLDRDCFPQWLELLDTNLTYSMPVLQTVHGQDGDGFARSYAHLEENFGTLAFRVERLADPKAWAEHPASRTRRFVTNVKVFAQDGLRAEVRSNLLVLRCRGDASQYDFISCQRSDVLQRSGSGQMRLLQRQIFVDQAVLGTANVAIFL